MVVDQTELKNIIYQSQHCQRNWDLSKEISKEDLDVIITAATQCPSKQNIAHYKIHAITNRDIIEKIHKNTVGFNLIHTNPQVLANLLLVFEHKLPSNFAHTAIYANQTQENESNLFLRDAYMAVGIASGYINIVSHIMGYLTGFCACFNNQVIKELLNLENDVLLMLGIGIKNLEINSRTHHSNDNFIFPSFKKQEISVTYYN
jgi:nitroreductase